MIGVCFGPLVGAGGLFGLVASLGAASCRRAEDPQEKGEGAEAAEYEGQDATYRIRVDDRDHQDDVHPADGDEVHEAAL